MSLTFTNYLVPQNIADFQVTQKIGTRQQTGFFNSRKILLSYDGSWKTVELNAPALFLRKFCGFYKSTHSKTIFQAWKRLEKTDQNEGLLKAIQSLWIKKNIVILGNTHPSQAQVFCFAEKHGDELFRQTIAHYINSYYAKGDAILLEGVKAGESIQVHDHQQTQYVKENYLAKGWEPADLEERIPADIKNDQMLTRLHALALTMKSKIPSNDFFKDQDLNPLEKELAFFISEYKELAAYFRVETKETQNVDKIINYFFKQLKAKTLNTLPNENGPTFWALILRLLALLEKNQEAARFASMTMADVKGALSVAAKRTKSLCHEIAQSCSTNNKVFVVAGAAHLLRLFPYLFKIEDTAEIKRILHAHKFVIFTKKKKLFSKLSAEISQSRFKKLYTEMSLKIEI